MSDVTLSLGNVSFQGFEVPSAVCLAGKQRLAIHRLMSGAQIIDVLGRDKETVEWKGILSGENAPARACEIDRLRLAGMALVLSWDVYSFLVLIDAFTADYRNPWWIPYTISCTVVQDMSSPVADVVVAAVDLIAADVATAAQYADVSGFQATVMAGGIVPGSAAYAGSLAAGIAAQSDLTDQLNNAGNSLSGDFPSALSACGTMASVAAGMGYLARAVTNLTSLEP